jgi:hypothetical protein
MRARAKLIPPDRHRCQVEVNAGSFLSFGKPTPIRCSAKPLVIVTEREPSEKDGRKGSMSMCEPHLRIFAAREPIEDYTIERIGSKRRKRFGRKTR